MSFIDLYRSPLNSSKIANMFFNISIEALKAMCVYFNVCQSTSESSLATI